MMMITMATIRVIVRVLRCLLNGEHCECDERPLDGGLSSPCPVSCLPFAVLCQSVVSRRSALEARGRQR